MFGRKERHLKRDDGYDGRKNVSNLILVLTKRLFFLFLTFLILERGDSKRRESCEERILHILEKGGFRKEGVEVVKRREDSLGRGQG